MICAFAQEQLETLRIFVQDGSLLPVGIVLMRALANAIMGGLSKLLPVGLTAKPPWCAGVKSILGVGQTNQKMYVVFPRSRDIWSGSILCWLERCRGFVNDFDLGCLSAGKFCFTWAPSRAELVRAATSRSNSTTPKRWLLFGTNERHRAQAGMHINGLRQEQRCASGRSSQPLCPISKVCGLDTDSSQVVASLTSNTSPRDSTPAHHKNVLLC